MVIHKAFEVKAVETTRSVSDIVNEALRRELAENQKDLEAFDQRAKEPTITYEALLKKLKTGKLLPVLRK